MAVGDITYTSSEGQLPSGAFACGKVEIDADVAKNVQCGFPPRMIELYIKDTGAITIDQKIEWFAGMSSGNYWKTVMSDGIMTLVTSGGPTVYGDTSDDTSPDAAANDAVQYVVAPPETFQGFTIPAGLPSGLADSDMIYWKAWR